jgi:hypothetical protein
MGWEGADGLGVDVNRDGDPVLLGTDVDTGSVQIDRLEGGRKALLGGGTRTRGSGHDCLRKG